MELKILKFARMTVCLELAIYNDIYYRIDIDGDIIEDTWEETSFDYAFLMIGNCFESKVQAAMYKNYYLHLYRGYQNKKNIDAIKTSMKENAIDFNDNDFIDDFIK